MRDIPASIADAWADGTFIGDRKPIARVTVQHPKMFLRNYALTSTFTEYDRYDEKNATLDITYNPRKGHRVNQTYADFLFTKLNLPLELPNVKSVEWTRSIDQDVADCTIVCWNTKPLEIGETPLPGDLDEPGYYTYSRGGSSFTTKWKYQKNSWFGMLVPDNIVRTYEGYGFDPSVSPEIDPNLVQTGVWLIDTVTYDTSGTLSIKMRDIGRILIDQIFYPPVVPKDFYDHDWQNWDGTFPWTTTGQIPLTPEDSSNTPWIGPGDGVSVAGHKLSYAFDGNPNTYWLSIGNVEPSRRFAYEWVQGKVGSRSVNKVRFRTKKKGYTYYISVKVGGVWQGTQTINYHEDGIGRNDDDIKYVSTGLVTSEKFIDVTLPKTYQKVQSIRVSLGNLRDFHFGPYQYRGAIRDVEAYGSTAGARHLIKGPAGSNPGRYRDYTDIVKLLCGWGGFFWPDTGRQRLCDGSYRTVAPVKFDTFALGKGVRGRIWGDFQEARTTGPAPLSLSNFDKKPLMDGITYIRDILGFVFFIDETGGVQWRLPNVFDFGCLVTTISAKPGYRKNYAHPINEASVITQLSAVVDSSNVREIYFVGDSNGKVGAWAPGFNPNPTGIRRMAGWTDQNFAPETDTKGTSTKAQVKFAQDQCQMMADMLSLRQLFTYRKDKVRIPANPTIQMDDQVRIFERVSSEGYRHYVRGIASSLDMTSGEWTYDLDTHWLGESPDAKWLFKTEDLFPNTQKWINDQVIEAHKVIPTDRRVLP